MFVAKAVSVLLFILVPVLFGLALQWVIRMGGRLLKRKDTG